MSDYELTEDGLFIVQNSNLVLVSDGFTSNGNIICVTSCFTHTGLQISFRGVTGNQTERIIRIDKPLDTIIRGLARDGFCVIPSKKELFHDYIVSLFYQNKHYEKIISITHEKYQEEVIY